MEKRLYQLVVRVSRAEGSNLPAGSSEAVAPCFVFASDHEEALRRCVGALSRARLVCEEVAPSMVEIPVEGWRDHVAAHWAEVADRLPSQEEVRALAAEDRLFFGPFAGFEPISP